MTRSRFVPLGLVFVWALGGCASMSAEECVTADWRTIGLEDGARGRTADSIGRHRKACAKAGVTADQTNYEAGRQAGLREFCQPSRGYDVGHRGETYQGVCPSDLEDAFLRAYEDGRYLHELEQGVKQVEQRLGGLDVVGHRSIVRCIDRCDCLGHLRKSSGTVAQCPAFGIT